MCTAHSRPGSLLSLPLGVPNKARQGPASRQISVHAGPACCPPHQACPVHSTLPCPQPRLELRPLLPSASCEQCSRAAPGRRPRRSDIPPSHKRSQLILSVLPVLSLLPMLPVLECQVTHSTLLCTCIVRAWHRGLKHCSARSVYSLVSYICQRTLSAAAFWRATVGPAAFKHSPCRAARARARPTCALASQSVASGPHESPGLASPQVYPAQLPKHKPCARAKLSQEPRWRAAPCIPALGDTSS
jgi:hypothetical protein